MLVCNILHSFSQISTWRLINWISCCIPRRFQQMASRVSTALLKNAIVVTIAINKIMRLIWNDIYREKIITNFVAFECEIEKNINY